MPDHEVGYRKPPKNSRFKPGVSGNPKGRPQRKPAELAGIIDGVLSASIEYREGDHIKTTTRHELGLKKLVEHAVRGNLGAADHLLTVRAQAKRFGDVGVTRLQISDWLPDYPGQTADQKSQDAAGMGSVASPPWWHKSEKEKD
jgi:hypothetical protein